MTESPTAVSTSIVVDAPAEQAFSVFTDDMASWWPPEHHILQAPLASMVVIRSGPTGALSIRASQPATG